ncbi:hypothetical protein [Sandaracinus amylolyticus]|nr:hypothetical protein [Sandaracinus amylolyticus]
MLRKMLVVAALLSVAAVSSPASRASACSAHACPPVRFHPTSAANADEVPVVPENGAILSITGGGAVASRTLVAVRERDGESTTIELAVEDGVVRLDGALEGDVWTLTESHACETGPMSDEATTTVRVGAPATAPVALGTLHAGRWARREIVVPDSSGPCSSPIDSATIELDVVLDASVAPWRDLLQWETLVDGEPFTGGGLLGQPAPNSAIVFVACEPPTSGQHPPDLEEGLHSVQRRASLPGSDEVLATDEIEIELRCDPPPSDPPPSPMVSVCSIASPGAGASGGVGAVLAVAAIGLAARRRRRV